MTLDRQEMMGTARGLRVFVARHRFLKEASIVTAGYFLYMITRRLVFQDVEGAALENASRLIDLENSLGLFWEIELQKWLLQGAKEVVLFFNWSYILTFFPVIIPAAIVIYKLNYRRYLYYRNIVLLSLFIAVVVYALFPLAPPRMIPGMGFIDTIQSFGPTMYNSRENQFYYNAFAAMPSIHFGWTILFGVIFFTTGVLWLRLLGVLYPTLTFFSIVVTGNHYILDALGGAGVVGIAFILNAWMVKNNIRLHPTLIYLPVRYWLMRRPTTGSHMDRLS